MNDKDSMIIQSVWMIKYDLNEALFSFKPSVVGAINLNGDLEEMLEFFENSENLVRVI